MHQHPWGRSLNHRSLRTWSRQKTGAGNVLRRDTLPPADPREPDPFEPSAEDWEGASFLDGLSGWFGGRFSR